MRHIETIELQGHICKIMYDPRHGEYVARLNGNSATDYFTDDRDDAIGTARHMLARYVFTIDFNLGRCKVSDLPKYTWESLNKLQAMPGHFSKLGA